MCLRPARCRSSRSAGLGALIPVDDSRPFDSSYALEPIGVEDMNREHIPLGPYGWRNVIEHNKIKTHGCIGQIVSRDEFDIRRSTQGALEESITFADKHHLC